MNKALTIRSVFTIMITSLFMGIAVTAFVMSIGVSLFPDSDFRFLSLISIFIGQGIMVIPAFLFVHFNQESFPKIFRLKPIPYKIVFPVVILSLGTIVLSDELDRLIQMVFSVQEYGDKLADFVQFDSPLYALILISATVIVAPFSEEVLFRGFLQKFLENHWQDITKAVLVTSMFFAAVHMNPGWIIQIYLLGIILGYLAWRTGSIIPGLILHALNNGMALCFQNYQSTIEHIYVWKNHVSPLFLLLAIFLFITGFKSINSLSLNAPERS